VRVYGSRVSYYTGKLEAYLRYKGLAYERVALIPHQRAVRRHTGTTQMPAVERDDGRWMSDSTPILLQLEREQPAPPILPEAPVVRFAARLIEDYADEWLWRPAMHYRWSYALDRAHLARLLAEEQGAGVPLPRFVKRFIIRRRQRIGFVVRDGVRAVTWDHVEGGYLRALELIGGMLASRPFLLGDAPSLADFGMMGPMLRHFGQDPTPEEIMRTRAPDVYEWVARVWNAKPPPGGPRFATTVPEDATPLLREICETHLVQLAANAEAFARGASRFEMRTQGCAYVDLPVSRYRVWCLEQLRADFAALEARDRDAVRALLPHAEAEILWDPAFGVRSRYDEAGEAPFNRAINVYGDGVPPK